MKTVLKFVFLFLIFSILFILPALLLPLGVKIESPSEYNALMSFLLLVTFFSIIIYLIKRLHLTGTKLFLAVVTVFWGLQTFMTQIETWYFIEAMPAITTGELINLFLRPLITSIMFVPVAIWVFDKWKLNTTTSEVHGPGVFNWKNIAILSITYVVIYFTFGYFIAWQFEEVRVFYSGSAEDIGFIGGLRHSWQTDNLIFPFQFFRGFLWIMVGLPIVLYLKGSKSEKIIACIILYSIPAIQLTVDNPFMPQSVRMAHLLEVSTSNALFGFLIGYVSTKRS